MPIYLYLVYYLLYYLFILAYTQSSILMNVCKPQTKFEMINGVLQEETYVNLNFTIDHRYLDGALAAKIQREVIKSLT